MKLFISGNCQSSFGEVGEKEQKYLKDQIKEAIKNENTCISLLEVKVWKLCLDEEKETEL